MHTALAFPLVGEDVLITGAGPIGLMAAAVARHVGARYVVVTDVNDGAAGAGPQDGRRPGRRRRAATGSPTRSASWAWREGFDVGLEMSGAPAALPRDASTTSTTAAGSPMLGLPTQPIVVDWSKVVTHMITIKGIYGREMYETWYAMTAHAPVAASTSRPSSPTASRRREWEDGFAAAGSRHRRQGRPRLD